MHFLIKELAFFIFEKYSKSEQKRILKVSKKEKVALDTKILKKTIILVFLLISHILSIIHISIQISYTSFFP